MNKELLFDRQLLKQNQRRYIKDFSQHNFLFHEVANRISENISFLHRDFENILEINPKDGYLSSLLNAKDKKNIACEEDLENLQDSFDLIVSNLNFHFINDIPHFLLQVKKFLKPNGVFIASFFGEENLSELADILYKTENEIYAGVSPRMPPTIDVKTAANLLAKAGFQNPISDFEKIEIEYKTPLNLLKDLKFMGQGNILNERSRRFFSRGFLNKICENYQNSYKTSDGSVVATFEIVTIIGWNQ